VPSYDLLVDGERKLHARSETELRESLHHYREEHAEDDPDATHVQVLERGRLSFLFGGRVVPTEWFTREPDQGP